jgi:flagellar hook-associated protein 1 FlgK
MPLGLFGLLNLGSGSLATEREGVEVTGHNLANVNNPAYARQRLAISTAPGVPTSIGMEGDGVEVTGIDRLRSDTLDNQIQSELSVRTSLEAQQSALQAAESGLGEQLDSSVNGANSGAAAGAVGSTHSLSDGLSSLFSAFQSLSTDPSSMSERVSTLGQASSLADQFNQVDQRLSQVTSSLNQSVQDDTTQANQLLTQISQLNDQIRTAEMNAPGSANDLRDTRQSDLESLAKLVKIDVTNGSNGAVNVSVAGTMMVSGNQVADTLQAYDAGGGQMMVRAATAGTPLALTGGQIQGTIDARDGTVADLRTRVNSLASALIQQVNSVHANGYSLTGSTGAAFFTGTDASNIQVNSALVNDPSLLQAAAAPGAIGDNGVALGLAQLGQKSIAGLGNQTFAQNYSETSTAFGQAVSSVNNQLSDQQVVENMLLQQRSSVSGVSLDEEMTNLTKFQRAFEASAKLITTVDDMLNTLVNVMT